MKSINKYIIIALIIGAAFFGCTWAFNHINAWVGILLFIVIVWLSLNFLVIKKINQNDKN